MFKNSRELLAGPIPEVTASQGLSLARCRPGDFAIYRFGGSDVAVAALSVLRAHGVRSFDGYVGIARGETVVTASKGRMEFGEVFGLHIFNLRPLLHTAFIDEEDVRGSIQAFVAALDSEFGQMLGGRLPEKIGTKPGKVTLTPIDL